MADIEVRPEPGQDVVVFAPDGTTIGRTNRNTAKTRIRVRNTGVWVDPEPPPPPPPPPDPDPDPPPPPPPPPPPTAGPGLIIDPAVLRGLPASGAAWNAIVSAAGQTITPTLSDQDSPANVRTLAAAIVSARLMDSSKRAVVINALRQLPNLSLDRALALARELGAYVIAADMVNATNAELGYDFKAWLRKVVVQSTSSGPSSLTESGAKRPNNWGTHAHGALAAAWAYVGDDAELDKLHRIVLGWAGDRSEYAGFSYGALDWQSDRTKPVGINPKGATISGQNVDGVLPEEMRRAGGFTWPPPKENYCWEALQGTVLAAIILERTGRAVWSASDNAILRSYRWLVDVAKYAPEGDDTFIVPVINTAYGTAFEHPSPVSSGKNFGWTDWLYPR